MPSRLVKRSTIFSLISNYHHSKCLNTPPLNYLTALNDRIRYALTTFVGKIMLRLSGIKYGAGCRFLGKPIIHLLPGAKVSLGNNVKFRSSKSSNFVGVHTPCIISTIERNATIRIGNDCGFSGTTIGAAREIVLGDRVRCGANAVITDTDWHSEDPRSGQDAPVHIGDDVWLGYGVIVLKGVTIGENTVIGAGSIVTKDIPANVMAAGNPCRVIKYFNNTTA